MVSYDIAAGLSVTNSLLLNQQEIYEAPNYKQSAGAIQIQIVTGPTKGSAVLFGSTTFGYTPTAGYSGLDSFTWQAKQGNTNLGGLNTVNLNLPPGGYTYGGQQTPAPTGTGQTDITFLDYTVDASNSDQTLVLEAGYLANQVGTTINVAVNVSAAQGGPTPTGKVYFTITDPAGTTREIGSSAVGVDGNATVKVDTQLITPGTVVGARYTGDFRLAPRSVADGERTAQALVRDVIVDDNPAINANTKDLIVVVVGGDTSAEQLRLVRTARSKPWGANSYIITGAHNVVGLGNWLGGMAEKSVGRLVLFGHGNEMGFSFDKGNDYFNTAAFAGNAATEQQVKKSLKDFASIDYNSCAAAKTDDGKQNMRDLSDKFNAIVLGADNFTWSDGYTGFGQSKTTNSRGDGGIGWWYTKPNQNAILLNP